MPVLEARAAGDGGRWSADRAAALPRRRIGDDGMTPLVVGIDPGISRATDQAVIQFVVLGIAQPKGSARAFMPKGARFPVVTSDNRNLKAWERSVRDRLQQ